ncbi:MAG: aspartyl protease family protein [Gammaproteobacteria bacterium]|nr:retropepsin-like domain-containing protein [Pseudomonadales bacterium]
MSAIAAIITSQVVSAQNADSITAQYRVEAGRSAACEVLTTVQEGAQVSLPFRIVGGRVYIEAMVNDLGPFTFAVDTGASGLGRADASLVAALNLTTAGVTSTSDGVSTSSVDTVRLASLAVGGLVKDNLEVITRDYSSSVPPEAAIAGIVGRDFFADGLLVIDFPARRLIFTRATGLVTEMGGALPYDRAFRVPVWIGDRQMLANLDTGAAVALVLPLAVYNDIMAGPLQTAAPARLTNNVIDTGRATVHGPLRVGEASLMEVEARVAERFPEVMIGGEVLQDYIVAFDQRKQRVAVCAGK